jgi:hypothetical protein
LTSPEAIPIQRLTLIERLSGNVIWNMEYAFLFTGRTVGSAIFHLPSSFLAFLASWRYDPSRAIGAPRPARTLQFNNQIDKKRINQKR